MARPTPSPIRDVLQAVGTAIAYELVRQLDATGRSPLRTNSALRKQLLSGDAVRVVQARTANGQFATSASLELYVLDYLYWVDSGRKKFAKKVPLNVILLFIKQRGIGQARGGRGRFGKRTISLNRLAFAIQNAIYKNGLKARPVIKPALAFGDELLTVFLDDKMLDNLTYELEKALQLD